MRWSLERKLFFALALGAIALGTTMALLVESTVVRGLQRQERVILTQARTSFETVLLRQRASLRHHARSASLNPVFLEAVADYDPTASIPERERALADVALLQSQGLNEAAGIDLLVVTDARGIPVHAGGPVVEKGIHDLSPIRPLAQAALGSGAAEGTLLLEGKALTMTAIPVLLGALEEGTLCLGTHLDLATVTTMETLCGHGVGLVGPERLLARGGSLTASIEEGLVAAWNRLRDRNADDAPVTSLRLGSERYRTTWTPVLDPSGATLGAYVLLRPADEIPELIATVRRGLIGIALGGIVVALSLSSLIGRQISLPLRRLTAAARAIRRGDFEGPILLQDGAAFSRLAGALQDLADGFDRARSDLTRLSGELRSREQDLGLGVARELSDTASRLSRRLLAPAENLAEAVESEIRPLAGLARGLRRLAPSPRSDRRDVGIDHALRGAVDRFRRGPLAAGVDVRLDLGQEIPPVRGRQDLLEDAVHRVLLNSAEALAPQGGTIHIESRVLPSQFVRIEIGDDGPGFPRGMEPRVFDSFVTARSGQAARGLGLATVRAILHEHGGSVEIGSGRSEGATIRMLLPTVEAKRCWESLDCVRDCRPDISHREECEIYRAGNDHRCWEALHDLALRDSRVHRPDCDACPVYRQYRDRPPIPPLRRVA